MGTLKENAQFFVAFGLFILVGAVLIVMNDKGAILLQINEMHSPVGHYIFKFANLIGDGLFYPFVIIGLAMYKFRNGLTALLTLVITAISVQALKRLVFYEIVRPKLFFPDINLLNLVEGHHLNSYFSFPSGHTVMAFSMFSILAFSLPYKQWGWLFFVGALMGGLSRIYLVQHFFMDVYAGAILSVTLTWLVYHIIHERELALKGTWADKGLWQLIKEQRS